MNLYYLRCIEADVPKLLSLGIALGALQELTDEDGNTKTVAAGGGALDIIGPIYAAATPTGVFDQQGFEIFQQGAPKADASGNVYWHANLLTHLNLRDAAEALATANPEIAAGLADIGKFFVTDATGAAVPPAQPARVFL